MAADTPMGQTASGADGLGGPSPGMVARCLNAARLAPSPDNNQPWAFQGTGSNIRVLHVRQRAIRSDVRDLFSWLAVGAAIENLVLAASREGWYAEVHYRPRPFNETGHGEHVATVRLERGREPDPLGEQMAQRVTNRRPYKTRPLSEDARSSVDAALRQEPECSAKWLVGRGPVRAMAKLVAGADRLRFETRSFHEELFDVLRFRVEEVERTRDGLDVRTLEMPGILMPVLRQLGNWSVMSALNRVGGSQALAQLSAKQVVASGALVLLATLDDSDAGFMRAGRAMQRLWLAATAEGLAVQPLGSLPLFLLRLREAPETLVPRHRAALASLRDRLAEHLPDLGAATPVMLMRLGEAPPPSARSLRYPVEQVTATPVAEGRA